MNIPSSQSVSADWLTECLQAAGHVDAEVASFTGQQIGTGQIGKCVRYQLQYRNPATQAPTTLVGKFPSDDPLSQGTGIALRNYYREVQFYKHLANELSINTPTCYYAEINGDGPEFVVLLQDLTPAKPGDQLKGCNAQIAQAAVTQLVGLQAPSWCREDLKGYDWLVPPAPPEGSALDGPNLYQQTLPGFVDRYGDQLTPEQVAIIEQVGAAPNGPLFAPLGKTYCLEHVDYRLDNLMIDTQGDEPTITVLDWQSLKLGSPLNDVAYFLGAGMLPQDRRTAEEQIVRLYHQGLLAAGISDLDWPDCWEAYRRATFAGFAVTVVASMIVQQTQRGDQMFLTMANRHSQHALDLGAAEFLR